MRHTLLESLAGLRVRGLGQRSQARAGVLVRQRPSIRLARERGEQLGGVRAALLLAGGHRPREELLVVLRRNPLALLQRPLDGQLVDERVDDGFFLVRWYER